MSHRLHAYKKKGPGATARAPRRFHTVLKMAGWIEKSAVKPTRDFYVMTTQMCPAAPERLWAEADSAIGLNGHTRGAVRAIVSADTRHGVVHKGFNAAGLLAQPSFTGADKPRSAVLIAPTRLIEHRHPLSGHTALSQHGW